MFFNFVCHFWLNVSFVLQFFQQFSFFLVFLSSAFSNTFPKMVGVGLWVAGARFVYDHDLLNCINSNESNTIIGFVLPAVAAVVVQNFFFFSVAAHLFFLLVALKGPFSIFKLKSPFLRL